MSTSGWSTINSTEISDVKPGEKYTFISHLKLNEYAVQSHVVVEGHREKSDKWYQITHCPTGINGPIDWNKFTCEITIPEDTNKLRILLNAGWSSSPQHTAVTWYDAISLTSSAHVPSVNDNDLRAEVVYDGLSFPTSMSFLGKDDFLVLQGKNGTVERIVNGTKLEEPLVDLNVSRTNGALGIATMKQEMLNKMNNITNDIEAFVFIYYDESEVGDCDCPPNASRLYRYELVGNGTKLVNPKLFISLPIGNTYGLLHEGGPVKVGPDGYVYLMVGDVRSVPELGIAVKNKAVNYNGGGQPDGRAGILRFDLDGHPVDEKGILGDDYPLNLYYAYGMRNSFGFDFDPLTGKIWATENGPDYGDEINLVEPGFNSGWAVIMGFDRVSENPLFSNVSLPENLVNFNGRGKYSEPEFVWHTPVGPTALTFLSSEQFGKYRNELLVADHIGNLYHFKLNENRTELKLNGSLADKIADAQQEADPLKLGHGFGIITDMHVGPDGYLYVVSAEYRGATYYNLSPHAINLGKIFRIVPEFGP